MTLEASHPPLDRVWAALPNARLVGGAVRDRLAGLPVADHDLATPDPPATVVERLAAEGIRTVPTGLAHGTVTAILHGVPFEITTLRRDVRTDGRHAETEWTQDWREDAARRDFTINAMSLDREGRLHDYFGGAADLASGRVRFVGDAATRIVEDHLRILRFFRFRARYGRGDPDPQAAAAIRDAAALIARLSAERVWNEMKRLLRADRAAAAVRLMAELGVLAVVMTEGADPARLAALQAAGAPADPILRTAALLARPAPGFAARLRLSGEEARQLDDLLHAPPLNPAGDDAALRRLLAEIPSDRLVSAAWLAQIDRPAGDWNNLRRRIASMPAPVFPLAGRDVVAAGVPPGREVGEQLASVRAWWLEQGAHHDREACLAALARQLSAGGTNC